MDGEPPKRKRRHYKAFLDPDNNRSIIPRTEKRWRKLTNTHERDLSNGTTVGIAVSNASESIDNVAHTSTDDESQEPACNPATSSISTSVNDTCTPAKLRSTFRDSTLQELNPTSSPSIDSDDMNAHTSSQTDVDDSDNSAYSYQYEQFSDDNSEDAPKDDNIMFEAADLSVSDVFIMIVGLSLRFRLSYEARQAIFEFAKILGGPNFKDLNTSRYMISRQFDPPENKIAYVFYCTDCHVLLHRPMVKGEIRKQSMLCDHCKKQYSLTTQSENYFVTIDIEYQVKALLQDNNIRNGLLQNLENIKRRLDMNDNKIRDVHDGQLYKKIVSEKHLDVTKSLTYNFNTDGAPLFHSSKKSFWPLQLFINELPVKMRFKHLILAALWITKSEPKATFMNLYMLYFVKEATRLMNQGVNIKTQFGETINFKLFPLCASVDSVARPIMQNRLQFNGYMGCSWCYIYGKYLNGSVRYPSTEEDPDLRSHDHYVRDAKEAKRLGKTVREVKGISILIKFPLFNCIWGFPIDYMHAITLGIVRQLWELWTTPTNPFYLKPDQRALINKRLMMMKPPHEIHRLPRPMTEKWKWKASEWRSWLLFYSCPCLHGILDDRALQSFSLLTSSVHTLLRNGISEEELRLCEFNLTKFVGECQIMYGEAAMTFNLHSLLHLVDSVRQSGPLWATSAFPFENGIFQLKQQVNGPKGIVEQISNRMLQTRTFQSRVTTTSDSDTCISFCENLFAYQKLITNYKSSCPGIILIGCKGSIADVGTVIGDDRVQTAGHNIGIKYDRCIYKNSVFHSTLYTRAKKTNDTVIQLKCNTIGQIINFISVGEWSYITLSEFEVSPINEIQEIVHMLRVRNKQKQVIVVRLEDIKCKLVMIELEHESYVCKLPNEYEIQ